MSYTCGQLDDEFRAFVSLAFTSNTRHSSGHLSEGKEKSEEKARIRVDKFCDVIKYEYRSQVAPVLRTRARNASKVPPSKVDGYDDTSCRIPEESWKRESFGSFVERNAMSSRVTHAD